MPTSFSMTICGIEELAGHNQAGFTHVLSILDPQWPVPEAFGAYGEHERLELRFDDIIEETPGMIAPQASDVRALLDFGRDLMAEPGANLLVHCHAGVSRSTASMLLILAQARPDLGAEAVAAEILRIRAKAWPNLRIVELGDAALGRGGTLASAVIGLYREQLARRPELGEFMTEAGRAREVALAGGASSG
ncbi:tyrosine phosphatase family protein [Lichenicoccus sp.]|uniref:tyrosine phosphatase family protein n=1 Tax=Lichenicoccus sp. TaxID=2781899 RepID=UPI003D115403